MELVMSVRPYTYVCEKCDRKVESWYSSDEEIPKWIPCTCERDVWMKKWTVKDNHQRARIFDAKVHVPEEGER